MKLPRFGSVLMGLLPLTLAHAQSIMLERIDHYSQTSAAAPVALTDGEYQFQIRIQSEGADLSSWDPAFYKPGSNETPSETFSPSTNTGTNNFTTVVDGVATPNDGNDYRFQNNFGSNGGLMSTFYPSGQYGVIFHGLDGASATNGLAYDSSVTFSPTVPQITATNNGAYWSAGLVVQTSGQTQLFLNSTSFAGYASSTYGALIEVSLYDALGFEVAFEKSVNASSVGFNDRPLTSVLLDGSTLTAGQTYTLEIQYGIVASTPGSTTLDGIDFLGAAIYYTNTAVTLTAVGAPIPEPGTYATFAGVLVLLGGAVRQRQRGRR